MYNYVRSRELEGTFPGDREASTWVITDARVRKGWGAVPEDTWPDDGTRWPPGPEPPGIDEIAKASRLFAYERVRSLPECRRLLVAGKPTTAAFQIDDSWHESVDGRIAEPSGREPTGNHTVLIVGYDNATGMLRFASSWGTDWGDRGFGYLPYSYFDDRLLEAWQFDLDRPTPKGRRSRSVRGQVIKAGGVQDALGRLVHVIDAVDLAANDMIGWVIAVETTDVLHVDDLFVRPSYRGRGFGQKLARELSRIVSWRGKPVQLWFSHADWHGQPDQAQTALLGTLGLSMRPSSVPWASAVAESS
jgi:ribosomal protein S18 acetylase RimI-like enzyme